MRRSRINVVKIVQLLDVAETLEFGKIDQSVTQWMDVHHTYGMMILQAESTVYLISQTLQHFVWAFRS